MLQQQNGNYSPGLIISPDAKNVYLDNNKNLQETIGNYNFQTDGGSIKSNLNTIKQNILDLNTNKAGKNEVGKPPKVASSNDEMIDTEAIYVYTGTTTGEWINGNWYSYSDGQWKSGGSYVGNAISVDVTLTQQGAAADAKTTGEIVNSIKNETNNLISTIGGFFKSDSNIEFTSGVFYKVSSETNTIEQSASSGWRSCVIPVSSKFYKISTHMYGSSTYAIYLTDENNNVLNKYLLPKENTVIFVEDFFLEIPKTCTTIYLNDRVSEDDKFATVKGIDDINKAFKNIIDYDIGTIKNIISIESILKYGSLTPISVTFEDNAMIGTIGQKISMRTTNNYKHCVVEKTASFYKLSLYTVTSKYYPFFILGVNDKDVIIYQNADNSITGQREFYIYIPNDVVRFYVTGSTNGIIEVQEINPMPIGELLDDVCQFQDKKNNVLRQIEIDALNTIIGYNRLNRFLNFAFITDTHSNEKDAINNIISLKRISKTGMLDAIFHGGDILSTTLNGTPLTLSEYFNAELEAINVYTDINKIMFIPGNHDNGHNRDIVNNASSQQYSLLFANSLSELTKNPIEWWKSYGYIDYPNMKIRLVILESFVATGEEGTSSIQDMWLENTALNIPDEDWVTIVLMHYLANDTYYTSTINILQRFAQSNKLAAVICGHRHSDQYTNELNFNLINVIGGFLGFDCFTVDTENNVLYETRIGEGDSRAYHFGTNPTDNYQII